jgi:hypothetical protein
MSLTADERALVAEWVSLGCPESANTVQSSCGSGPGGGGSSGPQPVPVTPPISTPTPIEPGEDSPSVTATGIAVTRARWDGETSTLTVEGSVADSMATLRVDFGGHAEPIANDAGRFRGDFVGVVVYPPTVTVTASSGATVTSPVESK